MGLTSAQEVGVSGIWPLRIGCSRADGRVPLSGGAEGSSVREAWCANALRRVRRYCAGPRREVSG